MALTLLFTDSFDLCQGDTASLKYSVSLPFLQARVIPGYQSAGALSIDNTAGTTVAFTRNFGTQPIVLWNAHIQIEPSSDQIFLILGAAGGPTPLLQLQANTSGTIDLLDGAGSVLGTTPTVAFSTTYWIEVNATYGVSGEIEVWLGLAGSTPVRVIHLTGVNLTTDLPDEFTFNWKSSGAPFSLWLDNITVWAADALSDRNGPSAVTGQIVGSLVASNTRLTFNPATSPCNGLVLGVALDLCAAPASGTPSLSGVVNERTSLVVLGTQTVVDTTNTLVPFVPALFGFATYQYLAQFNNVAANWNDFEILTAQWGAQTLSSPWVKIAGTSLLQAVADGPVGYTHVPDGSATYDSEGTVNLTQVYLEKVFDLTGRTFGCGEASYSF